MKLDLTKLKEPFIHLLICDKKKCINFSQDQKFTDNISIGYMFIDGKLCKNINELFNQFGEAFKFPSYFGNNWAAFDECMNDLDWLSFSSYILLISDINEIRKNLGEDFKVFVKILTNTVDEWTKGRNYDQFPTLPIPFHIVFQCTINEKSEVEKILKLLMIRNFDVVEI